MFQYGDYEKFFVFYIVHTKVHRKKRSLFSKSIGSYNLSANTSQARERKNTQNRRSSPPTHF